MVIQDFNRPTVDSNDCYLPIANHALCCYNHMCWQWLGQTVRLKASLKVLPIVTPVPPEEKRETKEPAIENIEEVVIAVRDADKAAGLLKDLFGMKFETEWDMPDENMKVKSERISGTQLQLVESTSPEGVIAKFVQSRGEGLNHIAFKVTNLKEMVSRLKGKGVKLIPEELIEIKNPLGEGKLAYIFIHPKSACGTLIELIETRG